MSVYSFIFLFGTSLTFIGLSDTGPRGKLFEDLRTPPAMPNRPMLSWPSRYDPRTQHGVPENSH